jgi:hypothetical protein
VQRVRVRLCLGGEGEILVEGEVDRVGTFCFEAVTGAIEEEDPETAKRRLRSLDVLVEAVDAGGAVLDAHRVRINVRFDDALEVRQNLLLGPQALTADTLLVPSSSPPEQRAAALDAQIEGWRAARRGARIAPTRHQASLDTFFRHVRLGLDAQWSMLRERRGSRFALLRWSDALRRALRAAAADEAPVGSRRAYLVARVAEHVGRVLDAIPGWHDDPQPAHAAIEADELREALAAVPLDGDLHTEALDEARASRQRAIEALGRMGSSAPAPSGQGGTRGARKSARRDR